MANALLQDSNITTTQYINPLVQEFLTNKIYPTCPYFSSTIDETAFYGVCAYLILSNIFILVLIRFTSGFFLKRLYRNDIRENVLHKKPKTKRNSA